MERFLIAGLGSEACLDKPEQIKTILKSRTQELNFGK